MPASPNALRTRLALIAAAGACAAGASAQSVTELTFGNGSTLTSYGQIDEAYLYFDDGQEDRGFLPVGNANSSTRAGVRYDASLSPSTSFFANGEFQYIPRGSNTVSLQEPDPGKSAYNLTKDNIRKIEVRLANDTLGRLWLGQGSMASDGIAELDLSGTGVTAYSSLTDTAGGFFFRQNDGEVSDITIGDAYSNLDGSRRARVRYDTPEFAGLTLSAAYGQNWINEDDDNDYYDAAVRYSRETDTLAVEAGAGYNWVVVEDAQDREFYSGSVSVLHIPTGLSGTIAGGSRVEEGGNFGYAKLGLTRAYFALGDTALSIDYGMGNRFAGEDGELKSWAIAAVQDWDRIDAEIFLLYRNHSFEDDASNYKDGSAAFTGIRWRF